METGGDNKNIGEQGHGKSPNHPSPSPSSSSSQNPFQVPNDATNNTSNECMNNDTTPLANESSPGSPFHEPTNTGSKSPSRETNEDDGVRKSSKPNQGSSEIQNPPVQVMERPGESAGTSPQYAFPSHVFSKSNINSPVEWSTASNESLFSIYMGNTSFSNDMICFKSGELEKPGEVYMYDQPIASPTQQQPPAPVNKFNDISQRTAEQQLLLEERSKATEAKAAETMREVIMESSQTTQNVASNYHRQSHGSARSYAFQSSKSRDKIASPNGAGEKENQQMLSQENEKPNATDQAPKSKKWLCFSCCPFCN